jgi:ATP-dependent exoDNAse (exonuclease V) beta subunit
LLIHDVLERAELATAQRANDWQGWLADASVAALFAEAARARGVDRMYVPHAARLAFATLTEPMALTDGTTLPPLVAATRLAREVEFAYPLPAARANATRGLVKGFIDALVVYGDELWVLDYKSDALAGALDLDAAARHHVREHYAIQTRLYAIAAERMRGTRRFAGMLFAFVRYGLVVPVPASSSETLAAWTDWLARIVAAPEERS